MVTCGMAKAVDQVQRAENQRLRALGDERLTSCPILSHTRGETNRKSH